jgi:hypothetical protein
MCSFYRDMGNYPRGAVVLVAAADFVAIEKLDGAGMVAEEGEGEGGVHGGDFAVLVVGEGVIGALLGVDGVGVLGHFEAPEAAAAPVGNSHDFDEAEASFERRSGRIRKPRRRDSDLECS